MFVKEVYECLAEYCMGVTREEMNQPHFSVLENLPELVQNPELHENSIPVVTFFRHINKLMVASQIMDFSMLDDLVRPDGHRFVRNVSAIINFAKFREERLEAQKELTAASNAAAEARNAELERQQELQARLEEARAILSKDQDAIAAAQARNLEWQSTIEEKRQTYDAEKLKLKDIKSQLHKLKSDKPSVDYQVVSVGEECEALRAQVVNSPDRIRNEIRRMEDDLRRFKVANNAAEREAARRARRVSEVEKAAKNLDKCTAAMDKALEEMSGHKKAKQDLKDMELRISTQDAECRELRARQHLLERNMGSQGEKLRKVQRQRRLKEASSKQCLEDAQREFNELLQTRTEASAEQTHVREQIESIRRSQQQAIDTFEEEQAEVVGLFERLKESVDAYHGRVFGKILTNTNPGAPALPAKMVARSGPEPGRAAQ